MCLSLNLKVVSSLEGQTDREIGSQNFQPATENIKKSGHI